VSIQRTATLHGVVSDFDEPVGLGTLRSDGGEEYPFHCTAIADGTRDIPLGTAVSFRLAPARLGRYEAVDILPR
jgi:CspA family cold shock protein